MTQKPKGMILMACGETARFSEPYDSLMNLARPEGWGFKQARSMSIAENWNVLVQDALDAGAEYVFLTNDDHIYPPDTLLRLLAHERDIVTGLYLSRTAPFLPVLSERVADDGGAHPYYLESDQTGLKRVQMCGDGCLLIHRKVLETIPSPRWELGTYQRDLCDHDNAFCAKVRAAGFTIWCDLQTHIGHLGVFPVFPVYNGKWATGIVAGSEAIMCPAATSPLAI